MAVFRPKTRLKDDPLLASPLKKGGGISGEGGLTLSEKTKVIEIRF
tara:strand:- start:2151 stop:2288 length:138 start_codon:yes stop_codon:yes gene_type:complete